MRKSAACVQLAGSQQGLYVHAGGERESERANKITAQCQQQYSSAAILNSEGGRAETKSALFAASAVPKGEPRFQLFPNAYLSRCLRNKTLERKRRNERARAHTTHKTQKAAHRKAKSRV